VNSRAGTGEYVRMSEMLVAGKTGTAEVKRKFFVTQPQPDGTVQKIALVPATPERPTNTPWYRGFGADGTNVNHAWFMGFAPADDPQVAFAVMVEFGGSGGQTAGRIARKILTACLEHGHIKLRQ
jgi:cell division protein FtsI/penicillin-binding protein 2